MHSTEAATAWAEHQVTTLADGAEEWMVPAYGSPDWNRLPPADPRRFAAVIEAAERWSRHTAEEERLEQLADDDPAAWYAEITAEANAAARRLAGRLARMRTQAELESARIHRAPHRLRATPGWPPIAVPGQPGRYLYPSRQLAAV